MTPRNAIPYVGDELYPPGLGFQPMKGWGTRFRAHMRLHRLSQERLAGDLGLTQGAIGHWLRGRSKITLEQFWRLCEAAGADPKLILFGDTHPDLVSGIRQALTAHPELVPGYRKFERKLSRTRKRKKVPA